MANHSNDLDFEIQFFKGILSRDPQFAQALAALGDAYTKKGMYEEGLVIDKQLTLLRPDDAIAFYNLACSYSLLNQVSLAFENIKKAIRLGYDDFGYLMRDEDLRNLRKDARFMKYANELKARVNKTEGMIS